MKTTKWRSLCRYDWSEGGKEILIVLILKHLYFVCYQANTQELGKDKWLCPLSGKKFKGPDFVRKHIFNKHAEKVEEVKKEVKYYNNYLKDPKRPQLQENSQNRSQSANGRPPRGDAPQQSGDP